MTVFGVAGSTVLCLVTPGPALFPPHTPEQRSEALHSLIHAAVRAGIDLIQVREPDLPARLLVGVVARAVETSRGTGTRIIVNDRLDVALAAGADGAHLGGRSLSSKRARLIAPRPFLLGRSVHGEEEAREADGDGVLDYLIAGTVFASASKPGQTQLLGVEGLARIVRVVRLPVLAIGGVDVDRIGSIARTGAAGFAAIRLFADAAASSRLHDVIASTRKAFDSARVIP